MSVLKVVRNLFLSFLLIALIGCTDEKTQTVGGDETELQEGELKIAYPAQPQTLDPQVSLAQATVDIMGNVYETLLTVDSDYNIQPMLAESYEQSDDGKTITFHLREGVLFHNGQEMMADDVAASMNRWKEGVGGRSQFPDATFEAKDDYTVVLHLPEPLSTALSILSFGGPSFAAIMPKEIIENATAASVKEHVGTGPFQLVEWKQDQHVHLTRFDEYQSRSEPADGLAGKKEALVDDLYFIFTSDPSTRVAGIQTGQYDIAPVPFDNVEQLESDPNIENYLYNSGFLTITFNKKVGIFTDVKARKAIAEVLDMEKILIGAFTNDKYYTIDHGMMMSHQEKEWNSGVGKDKYKQNDPEKAKKLLDEIGYNGEEITIITTRDYEYQYNAAVVIQAQLEQIGVNVNLEVYDWPTLLDLTEDENAYDIYVLTDLVTPEPTSNLYLIEGFAGWTNSPELENLLDEFRSKPSLDEAKAFYDNLLEWYWEYVPIIKVGDYSSVISIRSTVENFQHHDRFILWNVSNNK